MPKLTAMQVRTAREPGRYHDGEGLMLEVKASGAKSWTLRVQVDGRRRDIGLGSLSTVSLAEARERAREARKLSREGGDPVAAKRAARVARLTIPTFRVAAEAVHAERKAGWRNPVHRAQWLSTLEAYAFPAIGTIRVDQVEAFQVRDLLLPIWLEKPETARRVRQRIGAVLDWAHAKGFRPAEAPLRSISKGLPRQPRKDRHFAAMAHPDVPSLMVRLRALPGLGALALRFLILTAARSGEVRGATWAEIDLRRKTWTIPADRMKGQREHVVPLCREALKILEKIAPARRGEEDDPLFPGRNLKFLSNMTMAKALREAGVKNATVHGFRSAFRDWAAEMTSTPGDVVEAALAHAISNRVEAAYRRTNYLEKRVGLMEAWASYLQQTPAKVVRLARGRARGR